MWLAILATPGLFTNNGTVALLSLCSTIICLLIIVPYLQGTIDIERREEAEATEKKMKGEKKNEMERTSKGGLAREINYFAEKGVKINTIENLMFQNVRLSQVLGSTTLEDLYDLVLILRRRAEEQSIPPFK